MKQAYPAFIVNTNDGSEHPFLVCVPDMEIFTEGDTFADAIEMARDAIGLAGECEEKYIGYIFCKDSIGRRGEFFAPLFFFPEKWYNKPALLWSVYVTWS